MRSCLISTLPQLVVEASVQARDTLLPILYPASLAGHRSVTDTDADVFFRRAGSGPEFAALRRLLDAQ
jgi:hypothetical protein